MIMIAPGGAIVKETFMSAERAPGLIGKLFLVSGRDYYLTTFVPAQPPERERSNDAVVFTGTVGCSEGHTATGPRLRCIEKKLALPGMKV